MSLRKVGPEASFGLREDVPLNRVVPLNADALDDAAAAPAGGPPGPAGLLGGRVAAVSPEGDVNEGLQRADNARVHPVDEAVRGARVRPKWTDARRVAPAGGPMDCAVASQLRCAQWEAESRSFGARLAWLEKFWLVVDRLQVFAIIWLCSQTWPWPTIWLEWTRGVAAINLDFASLGQLGAGSGSTGALGRSVYGQIPDFITNLALPIIALALAALAGDAALRSQQARAKVAELDAFASRAWRMRLRSVAANGCLRIAMLLYAPTLIAAVRLLRCEAPRNGRLEHSRLAADPAVKCDSWFLLYAQCILLPFAAAVALLLPRLLRRRCFEACTYDEALDHEKSVQLAELEDVFGVDDGDALSLFEKNGGHDGVWASKAEAQADAGVYGRSDSEWRCSDLWLVAPFKRSCATREADSLIRKCLLVASFGLFGGQPRTQGVATFFIVVLWGAPDLYRLGPYRNPSTNAIFLASEVAAFGNGLYAMLTAWGLRDAFVMPRQQTLGLISLNGSATLAICTICLYTKFTRPESPAARSLSRIVSEHGASTVVAWVNATRSARAAAMRCRAWRPLELAPIDKLERHAVRVRALWIEAKRRDCLLEVMLRRTLEEMLQVHAFSSEYALQRRNGDWFVETDPFRAVAKDVAQRHDDHSLMRPSKRALQLKLLSLRNLTQSNTAKRQTSYAAAALSLVRAKDPEDPQDAAETYGKADDEAPLLRRDPQQTPQTE